MIFSMNPYFLYVYPFQNRVYKHHFYLFFVVYPLFLMLYARKALVGRFYRREKFVILYFVATFAELKGKL